MPLWANLLNNSFLTKLKCHLDMNFYITLLKENRKISNQNYKDMFQRFRKYYIILNCLQ